MILINLYIYYMDILLSFDVGIKNLVHCILKKINDQDFILDNDTWATINLDDEKKLCSFITRNKTQCSKTANFTCLKDSKAEYLCKTHKKKYIIETIDDPIKCEVGALCCFKPINTKLDDTDNKVCGKKALNTLVGSSYCNVHLKSATKQMIKVRTPKKIGDQNCNKIATQILATKLIRKLDEKPKFLDVGKVLIENQPSLLNPTMKTISSFLYGYFCTRGIVDAEKTKSNIKSVNFFSPSNKLKINKSESDRILKKTKNKKEIYDITKELGIAYCKAIISPANLEYLNKFEKQDDMCDSFLQAFVYLFCQNGVPEKYKALLNKAALDVEAKMIDKQKKKDNGKAKIKDNGKANIKDDKENIPIN
jgi:hypothetical protein